MKTIKQIANEIGVSKQAVYKRYKGRLHTELLPYVHMEQGTAYISEQGEEIIKIDFLKDDDISTEPHTEVHTERIHDTATDILIKMLQKELDAKNKQIEELTATIRIQAESINADRHNALAETIIDTKSIAAADEADGENKKRGFWRFWKK